MDIISIVTQSGCVGVAIYTIYVLKKLVGNHISHNTSALTELREAIRELKEFLEKNS